MTGIYDVILALAKLMKDNSKWRSPLLILSSIFLTSGATLFILFRDSFPTSQKTILDIFCVMILLIFLGIIASAILSFSNHDIENYLISDLKNLFDERKEIRDRLRSSDRMQNGEDILDIIQLNLIQISEYYTINKTQAKRSFNISISAIVLGTLILTFTILTMVINPESNINIKVLTSLSSLILQFLGGAYFYVYTKTLSQLNYFYSELTNIQDIMLAVNLCTSIDESQNKSIKEKIIISLLERSSRNRYYPDTNACTNNHNINI